MTPFTNGVTGFRSTASENGSSPHSPAAPFVDERPSHTTTLSRSIISRNASLAIVQSTTSTLEGKFDSSNASRNRPICSKLKAAAARMHRSRSDESRASHLAREPNAQTSASGTCCCKMCCTRSRWSAPTSTHCIDQPLQQVAGIGQEPGYALKNGIGFAGIVDMRGFVSGIDMPDPAFRIGNERHASRFPHGIFGDARRLHLINLLQHPSDQFLRNINGHLKTLNHAIPHSKQLRVLGVFFQTLLQCGNG